MCFALQKQDHTVCQGGKPPHYKQHLEVISLAAFYCGITEVGGLLVNDAPRGLILRCL